MRPSGFSYGEVQSFSERAIMRAVQSAAGDALYYHATKTVIEIVQAKIINHNRKYTVLAVDVWMTYENGSTIVYELNKRNKQWIVIAQRDET